MNLNQAEKEFFPKLRQHIEDRSRDPTWRGTTFLVTSQVSFDRDGNTTIHFDFQTSVKDTYK